MEASSENYLPPGGPAKQYSNLMQGRFYELALRLLASRTALERFVSDCEAEPEKEHQLPAVLVEVPKLFYKE